MRASQPGWRRFGGRAFAVVRRRLLLSDIQDTQCGFKAYRGAAARDIFSRQQLDGWAFDAEVLYLAQKLGYTVRQVPLLWRHIEGSSFRLGLGSALREVRDLLRIRWMHRKLG
jgi:dolichyl-phosphate beta-glucosyltransferase